MLLSQTPLLQGISYNYQVLGNSYNDFSWQVSAIATENAVNNNQIFGKSVFINEIHYDDSTSTGDINEGVEIAGPAGTDLTDWKIVLYNGNGGAPYTTQPFRHGALTRFRKWIRFSFQSYPTEWIQNGSPDGVALVMPDDTVVQFLSYEGTFIASMVPPMNSPVRILVLLNQTHSSRRILTTSGYGFVYEQFVWNAPATATPGTVNNNQFFSLLVNEPIIPTCPDYVMTTAGTAASLIFLQRMRMAYQ